jgi:nicotinate-nucleotide adenylyltransferase
LLLKKWPGSGQGLREAGKSLKLRDILLCRRMKLAKKPMNIGLFGGTFDPIHRGHLALATAAQERFNLGRIYFVPSNIPPHRPSGPLASYFDRYAMVVLATMDEKVFLPSLLEAPALASSSAQKSRSPAANYSIDTVRRLKRLLKKSDQLFFLIGIDAFAEIAKWREPEQLLHECEFIVASRPGYSLADVANALPETLRPKAAISRPFAKQPAKGQLVLAGATLHLLDNVHQPISATAIRDAVAAKRPLGKLVNSEVAEYIKKAGLYRDGA